MGFSQLYEPGHPLQNGEAGSSRPGNYGRHYHVTKQKRNKSNLSGCFFRLLLLHGLDDLPKTENYSQSYKSEELTKLNKIKKDIRRGVVVSLCGACTLMHLTFTISEQFVLHVLLSLPQYRIPTFFPSMPFVFSFIYFLSLCPVSFS